MYSLSPAVLSIRIQTTEDFDTIVLCGGSDSDRSSVVPRAKALIDERLKDRGYVPIESTFRIHWLGPKFGVARVEVVKMEIV